jgi:hypothetical protein
VGNDVGAGVLLVHEKSRVQVGLNILVQLVAVDGLESPTLIGPPSRRVVTRILLRSLAETWVGLASGLELLDGSVAGHGGDEGSYKSARLEDLGHGHVGFDGDCKNTVPLQEFLGGYMYKECEVEGALY